MITGLIKLAEPAVEPITLTEAKAHLRVDVADDDTLITALIGSVRSMAESRLSRALISQQWRYDLEQFPVNAIVLPRPPLIAVQEISYLDSAGVRTVINNTDYVVNVTSFRGSVQPVYGLDWPDCRVEPGSVRVTYTAGFGASASDVPQAIRQWMLLQIGHFYANREAAADGNLSEMPYVDSLIDPWRTVIA